MAKDRKPRTHWDRPEVAEPMPVPVTDYPHQTPRYLHKTGDVARLVQSPEECEAAFAEGWTLQPEVTGG